MTRCKFVCATISEFTTGYTYTLTAVNGAEENKQYWQYTPSGNLTLTIVASKGKLFHVGQEYYLDISEAN